jgi:ribosomal protein S18 acetylase RimI-like enzyme
MIRDFRPADGPQIVRFLTTEFPAEEAIMGSHPDRFYTIIRRVYRPDTRLLLGFLRLVRRPVFRLLVYDDGGLACATTLLTFPSPSVYLSMVVTDRDHRRRGYARALLERARAIGAKLGRQYLVLDVLSDNTPARALYEGPLGYRPLREASGMVHEQPAGAGPEPSPAPAGVRPYRPADEAPLLAIAQRALPEEVARVLPRRTTGLRGDRFEERLFRAEKASWVLDRGRGPEAALLALKTPEMDAAHLNDPIIAPDADPAAVGAMVRAAVAWCAARGAPRILAQVPVANRSAREALQREGFRDALSFWTLYRPVA